MSLTAWRQRHTSHTGKRATRNGSLGGTPRAVLLGMRPFLLVVLLAGCLGHSSSGSGGGGGSRPGVMPMLSELPGDAEKRNAILDQSNQTPGPELRKGQTKKEKKAETAAATAAAILGSAFSKTQNVTLGGATTFEESPSKPQPPHQQQDGDDKAQPAPDHGDQSLVPWINLKKD